MLKNGQTIWMESELIAFPVTLILSWRELDLVAIDSQLLILLSNADLQLILKVADAYSESSQTSKMELFAKIVNDQKPLTIFAKSSISDF